MNLAIWVIFYDKVHGWGITNRETGETHYTVTKAEAVEECAYQNA